jgi:truncated hemoglobin YjbI
VSPWLAIIYDSTPPRFDMGENIGMPGEPVLYDALGGRAGCHKLSEMFYARVAQDRILRPLFPGHLKCTIDAFAAFLVQFLGGPSEYSERRWWLSLHESHLRFKIGRKERDAWMKCMSATLNDLPIEEPLRGALRSFFQQSSAFLVNDSKAQVEMPADCLHQEIATRWNAQRSIEETVAVIRKGHADRAIALMESPALRDHCARDRAALVSLLAIMNGGKHPVLFDYVRSRLTADPALARQRYHYGRTLLHEAAGEGSLPMVQLLLQLGADPKATDQGGLTPLYSAGNGIASAGDVVRALAHAGANVNTQSGVKRCTALHMAARRGNVAVAEALLQHGANIEARDSLGETPLRRAVNCGKIDVAALLLAHGANVHSKDNKGKSVREAARTAAMKHALG